MSLRRDTLRSSMNRWFRSNGWKYPQSGTPFTVPFLAEQLGMNRDSKNDTGNVYAVIRLMLKQAQKEYIKNNGYFNGGNRYENWDAFMTTLNNKDIYVFISKREGKQCYYIQPIFQELEALSYDRLLQQLKGLATKVKEMIEYDEKLLSTGRPAAELLDAADKVKQVYLLNGQHKGKQVGVVDQKYHSCPFCNDRKFTSLAGLQRHMVYKHRMERKRHD